MSEWTVLVRIVTNNKDDPRMVHFQLQNILTDQQFGPTDNGTSMTQVIRAMGILISFLPGVAVIELPLGDYSQRII